jgi:hypothetical protein
MTPEEARACKEWGLPFWPAHRRIVEKLVALAPERADEFWVRHKKGFPKDEALALLEELKAEHEARKERARAGKLPAQSIEVMLQTHRQATEQVIEQINTAAYEPEPQRRNQIYEVALHHAIEQKFAWQQQEQTLRYDPMGLWGVPNYKTNPND